MTPPHDLILTFLGVGVFIMLAIVASLIIIREGERRTEERIERSRKAREELTAAIDALEATAKKLGYKPWVCFNCGSSEYPKSKTCDMCVKCCRCGE